MCEQSIGYGGTWDPHYAIGSDGTIFATTFNRGLRVSRDGGCTFETATGTANLWIDALTIGPTGQIWITTATTGALMNNLLGRARGTLPEKPQRNVRYLQTGNCFADFAADTSFMARVIFCVDSTDRIRRLMSRRVAIGR